MKHALQRFRDNLIKSREGKVATKIVFILKLFKDYVSSVNVENNIIHQCFVGKFSL